MRLLNPYVQPNALQLSIMSAVEQALKADTVAAKKQLQYAVYVREFRTFEFWLPRCVGKTTLLSNMYTQAENTPLFLSKFSAASRTVDREVVVYNVTHDVSHLHIRKSVPFLLLDETRVKDIPENTFTSILQHADDDFFILSLGTYLN